MGFLLYAPLNFQPIKIPSPCSIYFKNHGRILCSFYSSVRQEMFLYATFSLILPVSLNNFPLKINQSSQNPEPKVVVCRYVWMCGCMCACVRALCPRMSYNLIIVLATWFCLAIRKATCGSLKLSSLHLLPVWCFRDTTSFVCFARLPPHVCCLLSTSPPPDILVYPPASVWFSAWWAYPQRRLSQSPRLA